MQKTIEEMNVPELRREAARVGLGTGVWRAGAGRDALLSAMRGESVPVAPAAPMAGDLYARAVLNDALRKANEKRAAKATAKKKRKAVRR